MIDWHIKRIYIVLLKYGAKAISQETLQDGTVVISLQSPDLPLHYIAPSMALRPIEGENE